MTKKILLIEDDRPTIDLYQEIFTREGFDLETLETGSAALEFLKEIQKGLRKKPDLILLDLILPDMNGFEILTKIKSLPETKELKVVILTNYTDPELNKKIQKFGVPTLLKTNYIPKELITLVKEILEK